ncbi:MAG: proton-conducting transporter membrane subunit [Planctomycetota bacterium]
MNALIALPLILPLLTAALCALARHNDRAQYLLSLISSILQTVVALWLVLYVADHGMQATHAGGWQAPYGIVLVADLLGAIMVLLTGLIGLATVVYSHISLPDADRSPAFHPLVHFLLLGVSGAFLTGDLFNLYVCFEVMLLASFALLALEGRAEQTEGTVKYVVLNLLSSAIFLSALGLLYAEAGTVNMAHVAAIAREAAALDQDLGALQLAGLLFVVAFSVKAGLFPVFFWLPASYHTPSVPVSALFAGLLTKVGVYALIRLYTLIMPDRVLGHEFLLWLGVATMITGVLGAASQMGIRRILSFHIISQIGYMIVGVGLGTPLGLAACIFYLYHNTIAKSNLFLVGGVAADCTGSEDLRRSGGMWLAWPVLGLVFLVPALALAGIPPLSGFVAKLGVVWACVLEERWWVVAAALFTGAFTLFSMFKIWFEVFWKDHPGGEVDVENKRDWRRLAPMVVLALITIALGLGAGPFFTLCQQAATELSDPSLYIDCVLPEGAP